MVPFVGLKVHSVSCQMLAVERRRFAGDPFEDTIEMSERLKADLVSNFTDTVVEIQQEVLRLFHTDTGEVVSEVQPRHFLECFAEVECAHPCLRGHRGEREFFLVLLFDEFPGARDLGRLSRLLLQQYL